MVVDVLRVAICGGRENRRNRVVVEVVVNWWGARVSQVLGSSGGHDAHSLVVRDGRKGHGRDGPNGRRPDTTEAKVILDGRTSFKLFETEQLPEMVGDACRWEGC